MDGSRFIVVAVVPVWLSVGCAGPEQEVLDRYLEASQRGDTKASPRSPWSLFPEEVESWNILEISDERPRSLSRPELRQIVETAEDERDAQFKVFGEFRQENYETLRRISARVRDEPDYHFPDKSASSRTSGRSFAKSAARSSPNSTKPRSCSSGKCAG